jgi:hypothetical protein
LVKLQHKNRRDGGITVESTRYLLDAEGIVEVSEEHAEMLLRGDDWAPPSQASKKPQKKASANAPASEGAGRAPRTKKELESAAQAEGFVPQPKAPALDQGASPSFSETSKEPHAVSVETVETSSIEDGNEDMTEMEVEITPDMSLTKLKAIGKQLGLKIPRGITQPELYTLLQSQGENHV